MIERMPMSIKLIEDVARTDERLADVVLTVGSFDGVHLGHKRILDEVVSIAKSATGTPAVLTMRPHPRQVFSPEHPPNLLTSDSKKIELLARTGIEVVFGLTFDEATAALDPFDFIEQIVVRRCRARHLVVGHDFRFGKDAAGDYEFLVAAQRQFAFEVTQVPPLFIEGERVSSTLIREQVLQGDLERAALFLGRPYAIEGTVIPGHGIGATLGFPTANVKSGSAAIPAQGVYAAQVILDGTAHPAAINIGIAPTVRQSDVIVEAHLLHFSENLLGRQIEVVFLKRLRPERKFPTRQALAEQIQQDVAAVGHCISTNRGFSGPALEKG